MYADRPECAYLRDAVVVVPHGGDSYSHRHPLRAARECVRIQREVLGLGVGAVARSLIRRQLSFVGELMLSSRWLAPLAWPVVRRLREPVGRGVEQQHEAAHEADQQHSDPRQDRQQEGVLGGDAEAP